MNPEDSFQFGRRFYRLTTVVLLVFASLSLVVVAGNGETDLHISVIDSDGNPIRNAQIFFDKSALGYTGHDGSKTVNNVSSGKHLVVAKKQSYGRTSANVFLSGEDALHLRLKVPEGFGSPTPVQFGFYPGDPREGESVTFKVFTPMDVDGSRYTYHWDLDGDGMAEERGTEIRPSFDSASTYPVSLTAKKDGEVVGRQTGEIRVMGTNEPPRADISVTSDGAYAGSSVSFDAGNSTDPDGEIVEYRWEFDSGVHKKGQNVAHTFSEPGTHEVKLTVVDDSGKETTTVKNVTVESSKYISRLFYQEGSGMDWVTAKEISRNEPMKLTNEDKKRHLNLFFEKEGDEVKEIIHQVAPTEPGVIEVIGQVLIKPDQKIVKFTGKGYVQIGEITYDLNEKVRRRDIKDWNGNLKISKSQPVKLKEGMDVTQHQFTLRFLTRESLESVALDVLLNRDFEPVIAATTELFNYRKISSVKTSLEPGVKPSKYNLSPHLMAEKPRYIYATESAEFDFISFDPDGPLGKMVVDWGDGNKDEIEDPISGKNKVSHTYKEPGAYDISVTSYDTSGMENNFKKITFTVEVERRHPEEEEEEEEEHHEPQDHDGPLMVTSPFTGYFSFGG